MVSITQISIPKAVQPSNEDNMASLNGYCVPSVMEVEDEDFLPGAHPNCLHKNNEGYVFILPDEPVLDEPRLPPQIWSTGLQPDQHSEVTLLPEEVPVRGAAQQEMHMLDLMKEMELEFEKQAIEDEVDTRETSAAKSLKDFERLERADCLRMKERAATAAYFKKEAVQLFLFFERRYMNASSFTIDEHGKVRARDEERAEYLRGMVHTAAEVLDMAKKLHATKKPHRPSSIAKQPQSEGKERQSPDPIPKPKPSLKSYDRKRPKKIEDRSSKTRTKPPQKGVQTSNPSSPLEKLRIPSFLLNRKK